MHSFKLKRIKIIYLLMVLAVICSSGLNAQNRSFTRITTFDSLTLGSESHWNGSDQSGIFYGEHGFWNFQNEYDTSWGGYWASGWTYSNETDVVMVGNQFSSYAGGDVTGGGNYIIGTTAISDPSTFFLLSAGLNFYVSNSTYTAISMRDGDLYGKKFGDSTDASGMVDGTNGEDWLKLSIYAYTFGTLRDSVEVYLADYRFSNDSLDYILDTWEAVNLPFTTDSIRFSLSSSDTGLFGMNTPGYFCLDHITGDYYTGIEENVVDALEIYPNPAIDFVNVGKGHVEVYSMTGKKLIAEFLSGENRLNVSSLSAGMYQVIVRNNHQISRASLIKRN
jgi:hypothetical protein